MSNLIAIAYPNDYQAVEALGTVRQLDTGSRLDLDDAVAVSKNDEGRIKIEGAYSRTAAGATGGLFLGTILGLIFMVPVAGALFGTATGALTGKLGDTYRIDDFVVEVGDSMPAGSSAILMLIHKADPDTTLAALRQYGGKVIRTTLPDDAEARLRAALGHPAD